MIFEWIKKLLNVRLYGPPTTRNEERPKNKVTGKSNIPVIDGHLEIPEGATAIANCAFMRRKDIVSVSVPGTVEKIGEWAFSECANLERVTLREGLKCIDREAFSDCPKLTGLVIPDSTADINILAFKRSGLQMPVMNASRDALIYCPAEAAGTEFTVPEGIRRIGVWAFADLSELKSVHLPDSLQQLDRFSFRECGLASIVIPAGVRRIHQCAFFNCVNLSEIRVEGADDAVRVAALTLRVRGQTFLAPVHCLPPEDEHDWRSGEFRALAAACGTGNAQAMERMVAFFEEKHRAAPDEPFYPLAANFWRYRAYEWGSIEQQKWLVDWVASSPGKRLPSACLDEELSGTFPGNALNALGFLFFRPEREYTLSGLDEYGVVEVSSYESEDDPDSDGFGREIYYDWWYLDGDLCPVPGADCLHSYSNLDKRNNWERFQTCHDMVAKAALRKRRERK